MKLKIKKLYENSVVPSYALPGDAGMDLFAVETKSVKQGERVKIPTGIAMEIPEGYVGLIWDKSGVSMNSGIKILGGVIDAGYRGEIMVGIINLSDTEFNIEKGKKIAQILIQKVEQPEVEVVEELTETVRGENAFGSTS